MRSDAVYLSRLQLNNVMPQFHATVHTRCFCEIAMSRVHKLLRAVIGCKPTLKLVSGDLKGSRLHLRGFSWPWDKVVSTVKYFSTPSTLSAFSLMELPCNEEPSPAELYRKWQLLWWKAEYLGRQKSCHLLTVTGPVKIISSTTNPSRTITLDNYT